MQYDVRFSAVLDHGGTTKDLPPPRKLHADLDVEIAQSGDLWKPAQSWMKSWDHYKTVQMLIVPAKSMRIPSYSTAMQCCFIQIERQIAKAKEVLSARPRIRNITDYVLSNVVESFLASSMVNRYVRALPW